MSQFVETPTRTFVAGEAIGLYLRVKAFNGKLVVAEAGADDGFGLGTIERATFADGDPVAVRLRNAVGTRKMVAAGVIAEAAEVYGAIGGRVSASISGEPLGVAFEAATAAGDVIEVMTY